MTFQTKARPLLARFALAVSTMTVSAPADAADCFFAYTKPLPDMHAAVAAVPTMHLAAVAAGFAAAAFAAAFLPAYRPKRAAPAPAPAAPAPSGPIFCPLTKRWRDPVSRRFVKAPTV